jgi:hypothetical protein
MKIEKLVDLTRLHLRDSPEEPFYTDASIKDMLNEAQRELARDLTEIGVTTALQSSGTIDLTAGTMEYALPGTIGEVERVELLYVGTYSQLAYRTMAEIDESLWNTTADVRGTPTEYYLRGGKIGFLPCPDTTTATGTPQIKVWWQGYSTDLTAPASEPSVPEEWQHLMPYYAAATLAVEVSPRTSGALFALYHEKKRRMLHQARTLTKETYPRTRMVVPY